jgi:hypothetical protein
MFADLARRYDWVLPLLVYESAEGLLRNMDFAVIQAAEDKYQQLHKAKIIPIRP